MARCLDHEALWLGLGADHERLAIIIGLSDVTTVARLARFSLEPGGQFELSSRPV